MYEKANDQREATYGTAGVDTYKAKDIAAKNARLAAATACEPAASMTNAIIGDLDRLNYLLGEINDRQMSQIARLFGTSPTGAAIAGNGGDKVGFSGPLNLIAEMLRDARERAELISGNQKQLEQVG